MAARLGIPASGSGAVTAALVHGRCLFFGEWTRTCRSRCLLPGPGSLTAGSHREKPGSQGLPSLFPSLLWLLLAPAPRDAVKPGSWLPQGPCVRWESRTIAKTPRPHPDVHRGAVQALACPAMGCPDSHARRPMPSVGQERAAHTTGASPRLPRPAWLSHRGHGDEGAGPHAVHSVVTSAGCSQGRRGVQWLRMDNTPR